MREGIKLEPLMNRTNIHLESSVYKYASFHLMAFWFRGRKSDLDNLFLQTRMNLKDEYANS